jgi:hypothetical protein
MDAGQAEYAGNTLARIDSLTVTIVIVGVMFARGHGCADDSRQQIRYMLGVLRGAICPVCQRRPGEYNCEEQSDCVDCDTWRVGVGDRADRNPVISV